MIISLTFLASRGINDDSTFQNNHDNDQHVYHEASPTTIPKIYAYNYSACQ